MMLLKMSSPEDLAWNKNLVTIHLYLISIYQEIYKAILCKVQTILDCISMFQQFILYNLM